MNKEIGKDYYLVEKIGKGAFGEVFLTKNHKNEQLFATKKIDKGKIKDERLKRYFETEILILRQVNHENIIKLKETLKDSDSFYLVFEYCNGGDLAGSLQKYKEKFGKPFDQETVQYIMRQIISGFEHIHDMKIIHRDIKLENILVDYPNKEDKENLNLMNCKIKITDFGLSTYLKSDCLAQSIIGNPINMEPHIYEKLRRMNNDEDFGYDQKADIWSLGTICYEMLVGAPAFESATYPELYKKLKKGLYKIPSDITLSKETISFLNGMMQYDDKSRLDIHQLANHFFIKKDVKDFHPVQIKKSNNLEKTIMMNIKENSPMWNIFEENEALNEINPEMIVPNKEKPVKVKGIVDDGTDILGNLIKQNGGSEETYVNTPDSGNKIIVDNSLSSFLQKNFDEMNIESFYLEPLLAPITPLEEMKNIEQTLKYIDSL